MVATATIPTTKMPQVDVFGRRPEGGIYNPPTAFSVRNDCKSGFWKLGQTQRLNGQLMRMSIIRAIPFFGTLGETKDAVWLQVWFIAAPGCEVDVPPNTVCMTYIKRQSLDNLQTTVVQAMGQQDPGTGIFEARFVERNGKQGTYYVLDWKWVERETDAEIAQLNEVAAFLESDPTLFDQSTIATLTCIHGYSNDEVNQLLEEAKAERKYQRQQQALLQQASQAA
jgi:hypothetical protein